MTGTISIGERRVGAGCPVFFIAEAGVNHNGDLSLARKLVDEAANAGADAVKFQSFRAECLAAPSAPKARYQASATGPAESQLAMLKKLELSPAAHRELFDYSRKRGVLFLSTPFDEASVDMLDALGVPAFKVPSGEIVNFLLLERVARKGKPMILSTGMASLEEVGAAVKRVQEAGKNPLVLLHCTTSYPTPPEAANLRAMQTMARAFALPVGYSDHTQGLEVSLAAVALGACVVEKHFTLDRTLPGPDHTASLEPGELAALIAGIRRVEAALGDPRKAASAVEEENRRAVRRSLVAARELSEGTVIEPAHLMALRPAGGIAPNLVDQVVGKRLRRGLATGEALAWSDLA